jgi:hypothetical protein
VVEEHERTEGALARVRKDPADEKAAEVVLACDEGTFEHRRRIDESTWALKQERSRRGTDAR